MAVTKRTFILTIPNAGQQSDSKTFGETGYRSPINVLILAPDTMPETVNIQVAGPLGNFKILQSNSVDILLSAARATPLTVLTVSQFRLLATAPVAGARTFEIIWNVRGERG